MKIAGRMAFVFALMIAVYFIGTQNTYAQSGSFEWRGTVDDRVEIVLRGRNATVRTVQGQDYGDGRYQFNGRAPRGNANIRVEKLDGRGRVRVVGRSGRWNRNGAVIQIDDPKGGADRYRIRVYWD